MNKDFFNTEGWYSEFLSGDFLVDYKKQEVTFNNMKNWLEERKYYRIYLEEGVDYFEDDIDEAKKSVINDKNHELEHRYLFARQMYAGKTNDFDNLRVEPWNMHTISGHGISPDKISLLVTPNGDYDALSIVRYLYLNCPNKNNYRLLGNFIEYVNKLDIEKIEKHM